VASLHNLHGKASGRSQPNHAASKLPPKNYAKAPAVVGKGSGGGDRGVAEWRPCTAAATNVTGGMARMPAMRKSQNGLFTRSSLADQSRGAPQDPRTPAGGEGGGGVGKWTAIGKKLLDKTSGAANARTWGGRRSGTVLREDSVKDEEALNAFDTDDTAREADGGARVAGGPRVGNPRYVTDQFPPPSPAMPHTSKPILRSKKTCHLT
jgi:hypothetical protein